MSPMGRAYAVACQMDEINYESAVQRLIHDPTEWNALLPHERTRDTSALAYRAASAGLCIMRQRVWSVNRKHPYTFYKRAVDATADNKVPVQWCDGC